MTQRRVNVNGRGVYGRAVPLTPPRRRKLGRVPHVSLPAKRGGLLLVGGAVVVWLLAGWLSVRTIEVSGAQMADDQQRIRTTTRKLVNQGWWSRSTLLVDTKALAADLQEAEPAIASARVARSLPGTLRVVVSLKTPVIGWVSGEQRFAVGADGTIIGLLAASSTLPVVIDGSNVPVAVGDKVASADFVTFTTGAVAGLRARGLEVAQLSISETTLDLTIQTTKNYRIVFDTGRGVGQELYDLDAVLRVLAAAKRQPAEYIDVRIAGKAYYK